VVVASKTCIELGFKSWKMPHVPSKLDDGDSFFGECSTIHLYTSDLIAFIGATSVILHMDSLIATLTNGARWRKDNPQCDMKCNDVSTDISSLRQVMV
jgi:hypothetical protein